MNAIELRIGNWIKYDMSDVPVQIKPEDFSTDYLSFCEPIPLTEKWLLDFGFIKEEIKVNQPVLLQGANNGSYHGAINFSLGYHNVFLNEEKFYFVLCECADLYGDEYETKEIEHVHQLQNLVFALTSKELEFKKEKDD